MTFDDAYLHVLPGESVLRCLERLFLTETMERVRHDQTKAAALLGVSRRGLNYKLKKLGMRPKDRRSG